MDLADALDLGPRELVAFVGAGGKKTAMRHLVDEAAARGRRVGYTTTTHMPPPGDLPLVVASATAVRAAASDGFASAAAGGDEAASDDAADQGPADGAVAFAAEQVEDPDRAAEKVRGFEPALVDDVFASAGFDWLLVKADGARRREFKAPGPDEPQVPRRATTVVPMASVRVVGEPLTANQVHRPERVADLTGLAVGDAVTPEAVATVLASRAGGLRGAPATATVVPTVNKADTADERGVAREIIEGVLARTERTPRGLVTSFEGNSLEVVER